MKINKENANSLRSVSDIKSKVQAIRSRVTNQNKIKKDNITKASVTNQVNNFKKTFSTQEDLSKVQQKLSFLNNYQKNNNFESLLNAKYNNKPLFNQKEINNIKSNKNDLNTIIKQYSEQERNLYQSLNAQLVKSENTNAVSIKSDIDKIKNYLNQATGYNMKNTQNTIIDLLK